MKTSATILLVIALFGVEINAQNCYLCSYVAGILDDVCSPDNFNTSSALVQTVECPNNGKCFNLYAEAVGLETYTRSCTTYDIPGTDPSSMVCGQGGVSCCDGDLCNDENAPVEDRCYFCAAVNVEGLELEDVCSPDTFDPSNEMVGKLSCPGDAKCYAFGIKSSGIETYSRGCTADEIPGVTLECGKGGVQCCEGDLCNDNEIGNDGGDGIGGSGVSLSSVTITVTCVLSFIGVMLFH